MIFRTCLLQPTFATALSVLGLLTALSSRVDAQHLHFVAGVQTPTQGAKLLAVNSNSFVAASGYVRTHLFATSGAYAGYYSASHPFIVAAATEPFGGPELGAPALGSSIRMRIASVTGPVGGAFSFWEVGATSPTISVHVGETNAASWHISENDGSPGSDPYGHIHNRRFAMTKPGFYIVGFQFFDVSTNGVGGGPIHAPSDIVYVNMQAGLSIASVKRESQSAVVRFGATAGLSYMLQSCDALGPDASWNDVSGPVAGNDRLQSLTDPSPHPTNRLYRIRAFTP